jgi:hypothetical protein
MLGIRQFARSIFAPYTLLQVTFAIAAGVIFRHEPLTSTLVAGAAVCIAGVAIAQRPCVPGPRAKARLPHACARGFGARYLNEKLPGLLSVTAHAAAGVWSRLGQNRSEHQCPLLCLTGQVRSLRSRPMQPPVAPLKEDARFVRAGGRRWEGKTARRGRPVCNG